MNENDRSDGSSVDRDAVADENIQQLLANAYRPELPDPEFVRRVEDRMKAEAQRRRESGDAAAVRADSREDGRLVDWQIIAPWAVVLSLLIGVGYLFIQHTTKPSREATEVATPAHGGQPSPTVEDCRERLHLVGDDGLTPRERPAAPKPEIVAVGGSIVTRHGERQRVTLPDGSILYVNESTSVSVDAQRRITLSAGEVYIEVSPRKTTQQGDDAARFLVRTPQRDVTALGTRFAVRVDESGTGVVVTQGKVLLSDLEAPLLAGQRLRPSPTGQSDGSPSISPAPRASFLLDWTKDLIAAAESPLVPASKHAGGALVAVDPNGQEAHLTLRKYHVDVHIEDGFARTTIDQTYFNHKPWRMEGTFYFPLPPDASLSRLAMYVGGTLMEGGMAERDYARRVFETIKYRQLDPALLEWIDGSTFKMRVFPLEGRQEKRIILSYTQKLHNHYDRPQYRFPAGHSMDQVRQWSVKLRVAGGAGLDWNCPSHELTATTQDDDLVLTAEAKRIKPDRDIVLHLPDSQGDDGKSARFSTATHEGARYLMLRYRPELETQPQRKRRDWVFLFDASGERNSLLARVQVDIIRTLLENVEHHDTFSILTAGTRVHALAAEPLPATPENVARAIELLDRTHLVGALDLQKALAATRAFVDAAENPVLVHVGSGIPVLGERGKDKLVAMIPDRARYVGVGVGRRWNRNFMRAAAARTGGYFTQINPDESVSWRAFELLSTLNAPRLLNIKVTAGDGAMHNDDDNGKMIPLHTMNDSLSHGEQLCAVGRIESGQEIPSSVTVSGLLEGEPFTCSIPIDDVTVGADYLPRIWAKLEIDRLLAEDQVKHKETIIALSKAMYVMSPYTSLIVLENDQMYEQYKVDRGRKDHWALYPCPEKIEVVHEPLETEGDSEPEEDSRPADEEGDEEKRKGKKPSAEAVLQTILVRVPPSMFQWPDGVEHGGATYSAWQVIRCSYAIPYGRTWTMGGTTVWVPDGGTVLLGGIRRFVVNTGPDERAVRAALRYLAEVQTEDGSWNGGWYDDNGDGNTAMALLPFLGAGQSGGWRYDPRSPGDTSVVGWQLMVLQRAPSVDTLFDVEWPSVPFPDDPPLIYPGPEVWEALALRRKKWASIDLAIRGGSRHPGTVNALYGDGHVSRVYDEIDLDIWPWLARGDRPPGNHGLDQSRTPQGSLLIELYYARHDRLADDAFIRRITYGDARPRLLYQSPVLTDNTRVFRDLVSFAPGMNTSQADILAVLESEARWKSPPRIGHVDNRARQLIQQARGGGWQSVNLRDDKSGQKLLALQVDGRGRCRYERKTQHGLKEIVVCDGRTLRHLYPELGVGAKRNMSRFHRREFLSLVPWLLPPVEDLALGADLRMMDKRTVAIVPHRVEELKNKDGKPVSYARVHLVFDGTGRLAERRLIESPSGKTLLRVTYSANADVRVVDKDGKELARCQLTVARADEPDLTPDTNELVVLPLPLRTRDHVLKTLGRDVRVLETFGGDASEGFAELSETDALRLLAASYPANTQYLKDLIGQRFFKQEDRRIGLYTLLLSSNHPWKGSDTVDLSLDKNETIDPVAHHPDSPLARYIAMQLKSDEDSGDVPELLDGPGDGFVRQLAAQRHFHARLRSEEIAKFDDEARRKELDRVFEFIHRCKSPQFAYGLTREVSSRFPSADNHRRIAAVLGRLVERGVTGYVVRYDRARALYQSGERREARELFTALYHDTLQSGVLPLIDRTFLYAVGDDTEWNSHMPENDGPLSEPMPETSQPLTEFMRKTTQSLIEHDRYVDAILLAWQCSELDCDSQSKEILTSALSSVSAEARFETTLVAVNFLLHTEQYARADALVASLLEEEAYAKMESLWQLASHIAKKRGMLARSLGFREKAMELQHQSQGRSGKVNVRTIRAAYGDLMDGYLELANAVTTLDREPPAKLVARVVRAADRWRSLDDDPTAACNAATKVLNTLGAEQLAWDYLTTPLAMRPNEAEPWRNLARTLRADGELELADRAYAAAYEAEPTNAQILWDHADLLQLAGRFTQARRLYQQIARGDWQPRFHWLQQKAKERLGTEEERLESERR